MDIALLQEPYTRRSTLVGLNADPIKSALIAGCLKLGSTALMHGVAIVDFNLAVVVARSDLATSNFVVIIINGGSNTLTFISGYFKYRSPTGDHFLELGQFLNHVTGEEIVGINTNAHSAMWFSRSITNSGFSSRPLSSLAESCVTIPGAGTQRSLALGGPLTLT